MINEAALQEIEKLEEIYEARWQRAVDVSLIPSVVTQEDLCLILRRIIDTGESCLVGYGKVKEIKLDYLNNVVWTTHYKKNGDIFDKKCPFCGKNVRISCFGSYGQHYVIHCETGFCLRIVSKGL